MPEVTHNTLMNLPPDTIWDFVKDMNNWAPFLTGYQSHEIVDDRHSKWVLKGDVGVLARTVNLDVEITEWVDEEKVALNLTGSNEAVDGGGLFLLVPHWGGSVDWAEPEDGESPPPAESRAPRAGLFARLLGWLFGKIFRRMHGTVDRKALEAHEISANASELSFTLRMDAGGPMAPVVNAMLGPALLPAAQDLGEKIAAHLESVHGRV